MEEGKENLADCAVLFSFRSIKITQNGIPFYSENVRKKQIICDFSNWRISPRDDNAVVIHLQTAK